MIVNGRKVYQIGMPIHWGFLGRGQQKGGIANILTPTVLDPNSFCPEYKGFLVKLEKAEKGYCHADGPALEVKAVSASAPARPGVKQALRSPSSSTCRSCIGCKACEVACQEWNDLPPSVDRSVGHRLLPDVAGPAVQLLATHQVQ
jgi:hypothetical protein